MFLVIFDEEFYSHLSCVTLLKIKIKIGDIKQKMQSIQ